MNELESIPEYILLPVDNATNDRTGYYSWYIPQNYYTNQRGSVCYVSLADCNVDFTAGTSNIFVRWEGQAQNIVCPTADAGSYLGCLVNQTKHTDGFTYIKTNDIQLLTSARPSKITLSFFDSACNPIDIDAGVIALKMIYLDPIKTSDSLSKTFYNYL